MSESEYSPFSEKRTLLILPSGKMATVLGFPWLLLRQMLSEIEKLPLEERASAFVNQSIKFMLRENESQELSRFSAEDQSQLIELCVDKLNCRNEFKSLNVKFSIHEKLYFAVENHQKDIDNKLIESIKPISKKIVSDLSSIHKNFSKNLMTVIKSLDTIAINAIKQQSILVANTIDFEQLLEFGEISRTIANLAELTIPKISFSDLNVPSKSIQDMFSSYKKIASQITTPESFFQLPENLRLYPSTEMYNSLILEHHISGNFSENQLITIEEEDEITDWLKRLNPELLIILDGAKETIYSDNPDKIRHFAISLRELLTKIIHTLSPDDEVRNWTQNESHFHNKNPKRKTRLDYISRKYEDKSFKRFFIADGLNIIDLLNADVHKSEYDQNENTLKYIYIRYCTWIGFLIEIHKNS